MATTDDHGRRGPGMWLGCMWLGCMRLGCTWPGCTWLGCTWLGAEDMAGAAYMREGS